MRTVVHELNDALVYAMEQNPLVLCIGEDIVDPYGGAFKVTKGLSRSFPHRVFATPISEAAIIALAIGLAIKGFKPVVEIMFGDFITLCADQIINHAVKFNWMYNNQLKVPVVIRTPMGGGLRYGPTHSQSLEKIFFGIPGLKIIAISPFHNNKNLLSDAILKEECPVLFIENKMLYMEPLKQLKDGHFGCFEARFTPLPYETVTLSANGFMEADVTIACYGGISIFVQEAAEKVLLSEEIFSEIVVYSQIKPFNVESVEESLYRTKRLILVEEGTFQCGWSAEIIAEITERNRVRLVSPPIRIAAQDFPVASSAVLEDMILPSIRKIEESILKITKRIDKKND